METRLAELEQYLDLLDVPDEVRADLLEPYVLGFNEKSDGKSTPFWFMKLPGFIRAMGFKKDIASVRHDYDYYLGWPRNDADRRKARHESHMGVQSWIIISEFIVLRLVGWWAYRVHAKKRRTVAGYGTPEFIPLMPDIAV